MLFATNLLLLAILAGLFLIFKRLERTETFRVSVRFYLEAMEVDCSEYYLFDTTIELIIVPRIGDTFSIGTEERPRGREFPRSAFRHGRRGPDVDRLAWRGRRRVVDPRHALSRRAGSPQPAAPRASIGDGAGRHGLTMLPCFLGDREPGLVRVPGAVTVPDRSIWLLSRPDLRRTARVRAFVDFVAAAILGHRGLLEGRE